METSDFIILLSLLSMGFFGGFTHCISMCGPLVVSQISNNLATTKIEDFHGFNKFKKFALLSYHLGRITTYSLLGFITSLIRIKLDESNNFKFFSAFLIFVAIIFFVIMFLKQNQNFLYFKKIKFYRFNFLKKFILFKIFYKILSKLVGFLYKNLDFLFKNSRGFYGYFLGIILGFIPCGMLYGAIAIAGSFSSPFLSIFGMMAFGSTTFIALFFVGIFTKFTIKLPEFKIIANIVIVINIIMLIKMFTKFFN